jgi:glycosyltransferase involved in cell wall biosynthesis
MTTCWRAEPLFQNLDSIRRAEVGVIIPVRNEARDIATCIAAIAAQRAARPLAAIIVVNNTSDDSAVLALNAAREAGLPLLLANRTLSRGGVGAARRLGAALASRHLPRLRLLLSTDADAVPEPRWIAGMARSLERFDAVTGAITVCERELRLLPPSVRAIGQLEADYLHLMEELDVLMVSDAPGLNRAGGANLGLHMSA